MKVIKLMKPVQFAAIYGLRGTPQATQSAIQKLQQRAAAQNIPLDVKLCSQMVQSVDYPIGRAGDYIPPGETDEGYSFGDYTLTQEMIDQERWERKSVSLVQIPEMNERDFNPGMADYEDPRIPNEQDWQVFTQEDCGIIQALKAQAKNYFLQFQNYLRESTRRNEKLRSQLGISDSLTSFLSDIERQRWKEYIRQSMDESKSQMPILPEDLFDFERETSWKPGYSQYLDAAQAMTALDENRFDVSQGKILPVV
jgi:hypothetical protein